ncbi:ubiquinone biosynthesis methyltransferase UbiE [Planococcus maritimus]|uniref:class I SAM-dependent methyltransferase n=1 Tax=Planococcus maritimus TaxID=192421 RepID=UPI00080EF06E|nr:class I SAM-dependent methyltransferase [Planococcus maritimus]ANU17991.1 ubiquinone biosynthesis methyltransferase UbiE [Planococcus maritimus]
MNIEILKQNRTSWDTVAEHFNGVDALPRYGPFAQSEEELRLFDSIDGKNVLDIGCGSGHSLLYMSKQGAKDIWGVDLSDRQIERAHETLTGLDAQLYCAAMEEDIGLPEAYFDIVYSIYAIGWTLDLDRTFELIYSYLRPGGTFIFSWDHPLYAHLKNGDGHLSLDSSYQDEGSVHYANFKGEDAPMTIPKRKFSTYLNALVKAGFSIERVVEPDVPHDLKDADAEVSDRYYSLYKAQKFPTTFIIKARK